MPLRLTDLAKRMFRRPARHSAELTGCRLLLERAESRDAPGSLLGELLTPSLSVFGDEFLSLLAIQQPIGNGPAHIAPPAFDTFSRTESGPVAADTFTTAIEEYARGNTTRGAESADGRRLSVEFDAVLGGSPTFLAAGALLGGSPFPAPAPEAANPGSAFPRASGQAPAGSGAMAPGGGADAFFPSPKTGKPASPTRSDMVAAMEPPEGWNPNAPEAVADSITVEEDGYVLFDPVANDTDADAGTELTLADWDVTTACGVVVREADGKLRYTPDENFHGEDTINYEVTDGDKTASGTITVTVTPVNDAPRAFDDAWVLDEAFPDSLLDNDFDIDGYPDELTVEPDEIDFGAAGTVTIWESGHINWDRPEEYAGIISFDYTVVDSAGEESTATVKLKALSEYEYLNPVDDPVGEDDVYHVGTEDLDIPAADGVLDNDESGTFAVLVSHPWSGQLTAFRPNGSFGYHPDVWGGDAEFVYQLFRNDMRASATWTVQVKDLGVKIYHGVNPVVVDPKVRGTIGAFTVANLNDSDYDAVLDKDDNDIRPRTGAPVGYEGGEVDMVRIEITKPELEMGGNKVKITVGGAAGAGARLWKTPTKVNEQGQPQPIALAAGGVAEFAANDFPAPGTLTIYAELTTPSTQVGDVTFTVEYKETAKVSLAATGIWVDGQVGGGGWQNAEFKNDAIPAAWSTEMKAAMKEIIHDVTGGVLVGQYTNQLVGKDRDRERSGNAAVMRFKVLVADLHKVAPGLVQIDDTRTIRSKTKVWYLEQGVLKSKILDERKPWAWPNNPAREWWDVPNDDGLHVSSDLDLRYKDGTGDHVTQYLYTADAPGLPDAPPGAAAGGAVAYITQFNAWEFFRIKIESKFTEKTNWQQVGAAALQGSSRASNFMDWHSRMSLESVVNPQGGRMFRRVGAPTDNQIATGHLPLFDG